MKTSILTLALALAFSFTAVPADAGLTNIQKCNVFRAKTEMNFAKCMKIANLLEAKGKIPDRAKCVTKYDDGIAKAKTKFVNDKMGVTEADCSLDQSSTDGAKALDIVSARQELANFDLNTGTLPMLDDIQSLVDEAVGNVDITSDNEAVCTTAGGTYDAGADSCSVDITTDNAAAEAAAASAACTQAGGTWEAASCTPNPNYNCFIGGYCSRAADIYGFSGYTNPYAGHTPYSGAALAAGCNSGEGNQDWSAGSNTSASIGATTWVALGWPQPLCRQ